MTDNFNEILADTSINYVVVNSASEFHYSQAKDILESGKNVLIEKPITLNLEHADELEKIAIKNNLLIGGILQYRFLMAYKTAKKAINNNIIGDIIYLNAYILLRRSHDHYVRGRGSLKSDGGGVLMIQGIHFLDLIVDLAGDIEKSFSFKRNIIHKIEGEDTFMSSIKFKKGMGTLVVSTAVNRSSPMSIDIIGTRGRITFNSNNEIFINNKKSNYLFQDILFDQIKDYDSALEGKNNLEVGYLTARKSLDNVLRLYGR